MTSEYELELRHITKRFPGVLANDRVDLKVRRGDIHALMGENGAGKSTLMSILYGLYQPDDGEVWLRGTERHFHSPIDAIDAGLGMVFQSFKLFPSMTVTENVIYRREIVRRGVIDRRAARNRISEIAERYGLAVDPDARVSDVPVGVLQRVEIIKALYRDAKVLILDEPTAVLTPQESDRLFEILRALADDGCTIILITHKINEVLSASDRVTILRDGKVTANLVTADTDAAEITRAMTGRDVELRSIPATGTPGGPVLRCEGLTVSNEEGRHVLDDVNVEVRSGEIVGIAGVAGNGQAELAETIAGLRRCLAGSVEIAGRDVTDASVAQRRTAGLSYIPEDRHGVGTVGQASATDNLAFGYHRRPPITERGILHPKRMREWAAGLIERFGVRVAHPDVLVGTLSGGNLQKVVIARELTHDAPLLIAEQPTRGVDIGAIEFVHQELARFRDGGGGVLLISAELSEIMNLAQRILVMYEGRIVAEVDAAEATEQQLGLLMAGASQ